MSVQGNDLMAQWWVQNCAGRLPFGYREVEYIKSSGEQYIDTMLVHDGTCKIEIDMKFDSFAGDRNYIGQTFSSGSSNPRFAFGISINVWYCGLGDKNITTTARTNFNRHIFKIDAPNKKFWVDGTSYNVAWTSFSFPEVMFGGLALFGRKMLDTGVLNPYANMTLYSSKHYKNGVLVRNYVPCVRIRDSKPGLYDLCGSICPLTNTPFYINTESGTDFTWGELS